MQSPSNATTAIDLDGDGDTDIYSTNNAGYYNPFNLIRPGPTNAGVLATSGSYFFPKVLTTNYNIANISNPGFWMYNTPGIYFGVLGSGSNAYFGNFPVGVVGKFIGVRFINNSPGGTGSLLYGWVQVSVAANSSSLTIHDWAYEDGIINPGSTGIAEPVQAIPTLNEWGIIVLMTLLAGAAAWKMNKPKLLQA